MKKNEDEEWIALMNLAGVVIGLYILFWFFSAVLYAVK